VRVPEVPSGARVISVGIDVVAVDRFAASLARTPALARRLFTPGEQVTANGIPRGAASLAARFAVKEAAAKALGVPAGMDWHDCQVLSENSGRPVLEVIAKHDPTYAQYLLAAEVEVPEGLIDADSRVPHRHERLHV